MTGRFVKYLASITNNNDVTIDQVTNAFTTAVVDAEKDHAPVSTTTFTTDANAVSTSVPKPMYTPRDLYMSGSDDYMQEIKTFLAKPVVCMSGNLSNNDSVSTFAPVAVNFPFFFSTIPMWVDKTKGYFGIRMDLHFRMVVNANRFQLGRYMLVWKPLGGADAGSAKNLALMSGHTATLVQRTQMPHAEIDINCDTEIEFSIPFSNMYNFCHIRSITQGSTYNSLGILQLYPYVRLEATSGPTTAGYTVYVSAKNVELIGAAVPQMAPIQSKRRGRNETNAEQEDANMGPISSVMTRIKDATALLVGVPLISDVARTTNWFADVTGRVASVFGYTRPINLEHANRMTKEVYPYISNLDGPDNSFPLSLSYKNEIGQMTGISPTDLDEMDFSFLVSVPVYERTISWPTATLAGASLMSIGVGPNYSTFPASIINGTTIEHWAPYKYVSRHFKFWRGTMIYKFKIVKTEFHSGRLAFCYSPYTTSQANSALMTYTDLHYIHREVVDIRIDNEVTIKVPFISDTPYKPVVASTTISATGTFAVYVVDPLVAPATVPQTISIICEWAMGSDAEFSVPTEFTQRDPFYNVAPQMGVINQDIKPEENVCNEQTVTIGASSSYFDNHLNSLQCIGEKITSARALIRRPSPLIRLTPDAHVVQNFLWIFPFTIAGSGQNAAVNTVTGTLSDHYTAWASLYLYARGSVRLKFVDTYLAPSALPAVVTPYQKPHVRYCLETLDAGADTNDIIIRTSTWRSGATSSYDENTSNIASIVVSPDENQELQVPHYHRFPLRNKFDHTYVGALYSQSPFSANSTGAASTLSVGRTFDSPSKQFTSPSECRVYRSTADDSTFSYFLSIPPLAGFDGV